MAIPLQKPVDIPYGLSGCWSSWRETSVDNTIRTQFEDGTIRVRRRFTSRQRVADVSVNLRATEYQTFVDWYEIDQQQGTRATMVVEPNGQKSAWLFAGPPSITWVESNVVQFTVKLIQPSYLIGATP